MNGRRTALPGAAELFRSTRTAPAQQAPSPVRKGTGRERHSSKITVYVSDEEVLEMERARLQLRAEHGLAVDRGRIVRESIAVLLEDLESNGADSLLVRRLRRESGDRE